MNRYLPLLGILLLALPSCGPSPAPSAAPGSTPSPTALPQSVLSQATTLFSGPGNVRYESLAELPAGTVVQPAGIYADFVMATVVISNSEVTGFIWEDALQDLPQGLPALGVLDVPWEPMYLPSCAPGDYDPESDSVTFATGEGSFYSPESAVWNLEAPVRLQLESLIVEGAGQGGVKVLGSLEGQELPSVWWQGVKALIIEVVDGNYVLQIQDGSSENAAASIDLERSSSLPLQILFDQPEGKGFAVLDEHNRQLRHVDLTNWPGVNLPDGLFPERMFYFGTAVLGQASLVVSGLQVGTEPEGRWVANTPDLGPGLASLAGGRSISIGTLFDRAKMIDRRYCQSMQRDFSIIAVPEINWVAPGVEFWVGRDQYAFETVDRSVDIAQQRGWRVFGSHLVWGAPEAIPDWLMNSRYTREEYISILQEYIETVVGRYRGRIQLWSIANEAAERDFYYPEPYVEGEQSSRPALADFWYEKIGPEYIEMAFRWAREADPDAILVFNRGENPPPYTGDAQQVMEYGYGLLQDMTARGVPIDAVGLQFHLLGPRERQEPPQREPTIQLMQEYAELGLRVYITEFEVDLGSTGGTQEERYAYQAQIYRDMLEACLESGACDGFITWGFADSLSWIVCPYPFPRCMNEPNGDPLMFDRDFNPKPAYYAMRDALQGIPSSRPTTPTPRPTTQEAISNCVAQLASAPRGEDPGDADIRDDFGNPVYDGSFNTAIWRQSDGLLPNPIAQQQDGVLVVGNAGDSTGAAAGLTVRGFDGIPLDQPISFEADLALCSDSSSGGVNIGVNSVGFEPGSWMADCNINFVSSETRGSCEDFLWTQQVEHAFETPRQPLELGTWHSVRIDLDPATMSLTYTIDGQVVGTHVPEDAEALRAATFRLAIGMWKPSADSPLLALVDNVRIASVAP